jgi:hypothetical protein
LIGTDSGGLRQVGQLDDQPGAVLARLAHADDAARADVDAGFAHLFERVETVVVGVRLDDLPVEFLVGVEVVVVVVEAGFLELFRPGLP